MVLNETILTKNPCYKTGKKIEPKGIMISSVGCPQPSAKVFVHNLNRDSGGDRCPHAFVDAMSGEIYQTLPWTHKGCHSGKHPTTKMSCNQTHIGISFCEPSQIRYKNLREMELKGDKEIAIASVKRAYESGVELCAKLCKNFDLNPATDIISHKEGFEQGIANDRNDPTIVWQLLGLDYTMDGFRDDVFREMGSMPTVTTMSTSIPEPVKITPIPEPIMINEIPEPEKTKEQMVKISVENLRIRSGPGTENAPTGKYTGKGMFVITEIQDGTGSKTGWGKLRSGAGWISLDYVEVL